MEPGEALGIATQIAVALFCCLNKAVNVRVATIYSAGSVS
jgi:hypothetical protein